MDRTMAVIPAHNRVSTSRGSEPRHHYNRLIGNRATNSPAVARRPQSEGALEATADQPGRSWAVQSALVPKAGIEPAREFPPNSF